jgi:hypothetical protein
MKTIDWQEAMYNNVFEEEIRGLERRAAGNPSFGLEDVENQLNSLYILQGQDWDGRGDIGDIELSARLAAWEQYAAQLRAAKTKN